MNYLQRLAEGTLGPGGNIHPVMSSLFSTASEQGNLHSPPLEANLIEVVTPISAGRQGFPTNSARSEPKGIPRPEATRQETTPPASLKFLLPEQPEWDSTAPSARKSGAEDLLGQSGPSLETEERNENASTAKAQQRRPGPADPERLHDAVLRTASSFRRLQGDSTADGIAPRQPHAFRTGLSTHVPDEIQIHIGRIEVTAVQAAAPRAPAARPGKSGPSLEDYLQRRDRRRP
jgi:hypothetical protein